MRSAVKNFIDASPAALLNQAYEVVNPHFREPYVESWNLAIQRGLPGNFTLDLAYVGSLSRHLVTSRDINAIPYGVAFQKANQDPNCMDNSDPAQPVFPGGVVPDVQPGLRSPIRTR